MSLPLLLVLLPWACLLAVFWGSRHHRIRPDLSFRSRSSGAAWLIGAVLGIAWILSSSDSSLSVSLVGTLGWGLLPGLAFLVRHRMRDARQARLLQRREEHQWVVQQRGTVQRQIMRAREAEAMERRMRRCKTALLLSKGNAEDLDLLLGRLDTELTHGLMSGPEAAEHIGGMAAHLRHVFIERDRDDLPLGEACRHVRRWAQWLGELGVDIRIEGEPDIRSREARSKVPSMLFLGAAERWGLDALQTPPAAPMVWTWSVEGGMVHLKSNHPGQSPGPESAIRQWDAAFMLRHGGMAHAGGGWDCQLPLLGEPEAQA